MLFSINQKVSTPNGPGTVEGPMYAHGVKYYLIRHKVAEMTSQEAGECITPDAVISGLWLFPAETITPFSDDKARIK